MKRSLKPIELLGLSVMLYALAIFVGYDTFIGSALALIGLLLLVFAIIAGVRKLVKKS